MRLRDRGLPAPGTTLTTVATVAALAVGAGLGSALRVWLLFQLVRHRIPGGVAWVNLPAAAVAGAAVGAAGGGWPLVVVLGICGGLSTYSAFALELAVAIRTGDRSGAVASVGGVVLGLAAGLGAAAVATAVRAGP